MFLGSLGKHGQTDSEPYPVLLRRLAPLACRKAHEISEESKASIMTSEVQGVEHVLPCADISTLSSSSCAERSSGTDTQACNLQDWPWSPDADQQGYSEDSDDDCSSSSSSGSEPDEYGHVFRPFDIDADPIHHVEGWWGMASYPSCIRRARVCLQGTIWEELPSNRPAVSRLSI
eukprot:TRINITY_DN34625_c0_g1_i1.p1 TRINITY_DN34625_c0_g1~~TRINITY_DN34625_c0_g1_i1.p1  ORF type:complete len:175 (-),score=17.00 TRINITY_DN34625_c0_g1_i1:46-570(-)